MSLKNLFPKVYLKVHLTRTSIVVRQRTVCHSLIQSSSFSTLDKESPALTEVSLKFDSYRPKDTKDLNSTKSKPKLEPERILIILHGLFGSKQNWSSLGKAFQASLAEKNYSVYSLDLRNHGDSPHHEDMRYLSMAYDVASFIRNLPVSKNSSPREITLMGHSLGGRVAMTYALASISQKPDVFPTLKKLVVVDISPGEINIKSQFGSYVELMQKIDNANLKKQSEADSMLKEGGIEELGIRQFLLTNYKKLPGSTGNYRFRNPLSIIKSQLDKLGQVDPVYLSGLTYSPSTLFIAGQRSSYIPDSAHDSIKTTFPNSTIKSIDAGHWVHAEKPKEFLTTVCQFLEQ